MSSKQTSKIYRPLFLIILSGILLISFLLLSEPSQSNFSFNLIPLSLLWVFIYELLNTMFCYIAKSLSYSRKKVGSTSLASLAVVSVMFSALGQLQVFDVLLLVALVLLGVFYFSRTWPK